MMSQKRCWQYMVVHCLLWNYQIDIDHDQSDVEMRMWERQLGRFNWLIDLKMGRAQLMTLL